MTESEQPPVMVVDDDPRIIEMIGEILAIHRIAVIGAGSGREALASRYDVVFATSGARALQLASAGGIDIVLLDVMMPELSGYEVCTRLKGHPETQDIPILFLTALTAAEDESKGLELGAEDYITKPVNPAILRARVKTHLRLKAAADFLRDKSAYLERELAQSRELQHMADSIRLLARSFEVSGGGSGSR